MEITKLLGVKRKALLNVLRSLSSIISEERIVDPQIKLAKSEREEKGSPSVPRTFSLKIRKLVIRNQ
jgi:hypothetical protein